MFPIIEIDCLETRVHPIRDMFRFFASGRFARTIDFFPTRVGLPDMAVVTRPSIFGTITRRVWRIDELERLSIEIGVKRPVLEGVHFFLQPVPDASIPDSPACFFANDELGGPSSRKADRRRDRRGCARYQDDRGEDCMAAATDSEFHEGAPLVLKTDLNRRWTAQPHAPGDAGRLRFSRDCEEPTST
ncbi:MAG: hypothetical protein P8R42_23935 [Candidatus Binatia bacterium]|nr:hypothetical protein [Candidatus Binatia bacterium]